MEVLVTVAISYYDVLETVMCICAASGNDSYYDVLETVMCIWAASGIDTVPCLYVVILIGMGYNKTQNSN